ncbi:hypothetical protein [Streptomyces sp. NPDC004008]
MTDCTPPAPGIARRLRPFGQQPQRWARRRSRAVRGAQVCCGPSCTVGCEPVLIRERTGWGWIDWTVPADGSLPERPHRITVFTPIATLAQHLALRWLARRPARRIRLASVTVRTATAVALVLSVAAAALAITHGVAIGIVLPAAALAPLLVERLSDRLDARASGHVRIVEAEAACHCLQRLAALYAGVVQAAAGSDACGLRRAIEIGYHQLFDTADLLQRRDTRSASSELIAAERLMLQLALQAGQIATPAQGDALSRRQDRLGVHHRLGPYPPAPCRQAQPSAAHTTPIPSTKEEAHMPQHGPEQRTRGVFLLFAHEAYYPAGAQEINTSLVAAASLLHPRVRQPDGARIYDRLTRGRLPGEIVPLATLTHELDGGALWPEVGDWEAVTADLLQLIGDQECDALSLALPDIARALVCCGPHSEVRAYDPAAGRYQVYGPADRIEVLVEVRKQLAWAEAGCAWWPGDGLLASVNPEEAT